MRERESAREGSELSSGERLMATVTVTATMAAHGCKQDNKRLTVEQNLIKVMMRGKYVCVCVSALERVCVQVGARAFIYEKLYEM